jgi:hypothetical protein
MPVTHATQSAATDNAAYQESSGEWNAAHNAPEFEIPFFGRIGAATWSTMPTAVTELFATANGNHRRTTDLRYANNARLDVVIDAAGGTGSALRCQYSINAGSTWNYLDNTSGPSADITAVGLRQSASVAINAAAQIDGVLLRIVGLGTATGSPIIRNVVLYVW